MKFCDAHWAKLRAGVQARGMWHLVASSGDDMGARIDRELEDGKSSAASFDPLMAATLAIYGNAINAGGLYLMGQHDNGAEFCPLCELDAHAPNDRPNAGPLSVQWIDGCLDAQQAHARSLGLLSAAS